jgi:uncharacterized protein (DUF488 family)
VKPAGNQEIVHMMTSNFARNNIEKFPNAVSIARSFRWFKGRRYSQLAPSRDLFTKYLSGMVNETEYAIEYQRETLNKLDPMKVLEELGSDAVLLCWEAPGKFCHRRLVAEWLEEALCIEVPEYIPQKI